MWHLLSTGESHNPAARSKVTSLLRVSAPCGVTQYYTGCSCIKVTKTEFVASVKPETVSPLTQVSPSCLLGRRRDESASATYYFRQKSQLEQAASKQCSPGPTSLLKEWLYYRPLQQGENEFSLRNKQVDCTTSELCTHGVPDTASANLLSAVRVNVFAFIHR